MAAWWDAQTAGLIGAVGGSAIGIMGGLVGTLVGVLAPRGIGRGPVLALMGAMVAAGAALLVAGVAALSMGQPYHVWFPLCLGGVISTAVFGSLLPVVLVRYRQAEQRRLMAEELRRA